MAFQHNSTLADTEPDWGAIDKSALPRAAFAGPGEPGKKSTWSYPHHWIKGGTRKDKDGIWTDGTMFLHKGGLNAAWSAANGGRSGEQASQAVKDHLQKHRHALGLDKADAPVKGQREHPLVFNSFQDKCWAILPAKLEEIVALAEAMLEGKSIDWPEAANGKGGNGAQDEPYQVVDGVAVIPVYGTLDKRMNLFTAMSGGTSYELLGSQLQQALTDPAVQAILLDVDSPGGSVDGVKTLADQIMAARGQKPIVAFGNGQMTSAAYWIGASAAKVIADDTAVVGSIGVVMTHFDRSAADAQRGVKRTHIYSGRYKVAGSDAQPLSPDDQAYLQAISDQYYQLFLSSISQARGGDTAAVHQERADGRLFIGRAAKTAGLVDQIGTFNDALALAKQLASKPGQGGMRMDRATLESQHPELFAEVKGLGEAAAAAQAKTEGYEAGVKAERERVMEIFEAAGGKGLLLQMLSEGMEVKPALKTMLANQAAVNAEALASMRGAAPPALGTDPPKIEVVKEPLAADAPLKERAQAAWDDPQSGPTLKNEYGGRFDLYLTYCQMEEAGRVKKENR